MDKDTAIAAARFLACRLAEASVRVSKLVLFGSCAHGESRDDSDVDVVVISEDFRGKDIFERAEMIIAAERETIHQFMIPLDVLMMTPEEYEDRDSLMGQTVRAGSEVVPIA